MRAFDWEVAEVTADEAAAWFEANRPPPAQIPAPTTTPSPGPKGRHRRRRPRRCRRASQRQGRRLRPPLRDLAAAGQPVRVRDALAVPVPLRYRRFITGNCCDARIAQMLADPGFGATATSAASSWPACAPIRLAAPVDPDDLAAIELPRSSATSAPPA
ncbi:MAG: hypothetical protein HS111_23440 [Kofleriaceae bacterium]|nr:hypothetical protein [Kofleriaceae bacterium]